MIHCQRQLEYYSSDDESYNDNNHEFNDDNFVNYNFDNVTVSEMFYNRSVLTDKEVDLYLPEVETSNMDEFIAFEIFNKRNKKSNLRFYNNLLCSYEKKMEHLHRRRDLQLMKHYCLELGNELFVKCGASIRINSGSGIYSLWKHWCESMGIKEKDINFKYTWERVFI